MKILFILCLSLLFVNPALAVAPAGSGHKDRSNLQITIKSDELVTDNKGRTAVFTGKVIAKQGDIVIYADKVTINYGTKKEEVERIETEGNVRIIQENRTGMADRANYYSKEGRITLTGNPKLMQGGDTLTGENITYFLDEDRSIVTSGTNKRVEAVIQPPARKGNAAPASR
ncbi:lipopolysaccharide transport periplasmic protein LptA [Geobacter sp. SVR]|uniref:lipopolysaccharide transport periplasmic protein LptA n=1 Tax=Geobacter sp. SVR TaxID=2495594 RepID=UPI00143F0177|nr:lipopolysaccharide transport periplasmic protein LptA [Geobacter sp. SVR]BCS53465.1 hypothetical protein GSVR_17730 [Geobacter sp. SVR]GCF85408.1 lipopolysaccharide export system protein LptA [Geobacter sp. SVR]